MEWQLIYDNDRLQALGVTVNDIREAVSQHYTTDFLGMAETRSADGTAVWMRIMWLSCFLPDLGLGLVCSSISAKIFCALVIGYRIFLKNINKLLKILNLFAHLLN